jgi:hypothetical protein
MGNIFSSIEEVPPATKQTVPLRTVCIDVPQTEPYELVRSSSVLKSGNSRMKLEPIFALARGNPILETFVLSTYLQTGPNFHCNKDSVRGFEDEELAVYYINKFDDNNFCKYIENFRSIISPQMLPLLSKEKLKMWSGTKIDMSNPTVARLLRRAVTENLTNYGTGKDPYLLLRKVVKYVNHDADFLFLDGKKKDWIEIVQLTKEVKLSMGEDYLAIIEMLMYEDRTFPVEIFTDCHPKISTLLIKFYANATMQMQTELSMKDNYISNLKSEVETLKTSCTTTTTPEFQKGLKPLSEYTISMCSQPGNSETENTGLDF